VGQAPVSREQHAARDANRWALGKYQEGFFMDIENRDHILYAINNLSANYVQRYLKAAPTRMELLKKWENDEQLLDSELGEMISNGLIVQSDGVYSLTPDGRRLAQQNHAREFGSWMIACEKSVAYREFCKELYRSDHCQFDMMTQVQLEKLLDVLNISKCQSILDVGCGTGALTEYIADYTDGNIIGIDFSSEAIEFAQKRTKKKQNRLSFQDMDMDEINFPSNSFDTVLSIDTLYFVNDLYKTINAIRGSLQEKGQMGIFYSAKISVDDPKEMLRPENTVLVKALEKCGMQYETWDFTAEEKELWKKTVKIANELKNQFVEEGNLSIYEGRINEATRELVFFDTERKSRYLYHAWL
jgi:ubiquinone/menaquinone biosynthesis C-methylase UbiE